MTPWPATTTSPARSKEQAAEVVAKSMETGYRHIRLQYGEGGYGGGGFIRANEGNRAEGGYQGQAFDEDLYVETIPPVFEYVRSKVGIAPKLLHDVHSHLTAQQRDPLRQEDGAVPHVLRRGPAAARSTSTGIPRFAKPAPLRRPSARCSPTPPNTTR